MSDEHTCKNMMLRSMVNIVRCWVRQMKKYWVVFLSFVFLVLLSEPSFSISMKVDRVTVNAPSGVSGGWVDVTFSSAFGSVPAVFTFPTDANVDPATTRIRNVTTTGFQILLVEPQGSDGSTNAMTVDFFAAELGLYTFPGGVRMEVGVLSTANQQGASVSPVSWDNVSFSQVFSNPSVLSQIQTTNSQPGLDAGIVSEPWLEVAVQDLTSTSMDIALERSETSSGLLVAESLAYLVMASSSEASFSGVTIKALAASGVLGVDNACRTVNFPSSFSSIPLAVASQNSRNGNNGGWVRRCSLSSSAVGLQIDEDMAVDTERSHIAENVGVLSISGAFFGSRNGKNLSAGQVSILAGASTSNWTDVVFPNTFDSKPLVFTLMTDDEPDPSAIRIRNVTANGFQVAAFKAENGVNASSQTDIDYVAIVPGEHVLPSGDIFEAQSMLTNKAQGSVGSVGWDTKTFATSFLSAPALLTKVQSTTNEPGLTPSSPSVPWIVEAVQSLSNTSFDFALDTVRTTSGTLNAQEQYAYFAVRDQANAQLEATDGQMIDYEMTLSADNIFGWANGCYSTNFLDAYTTPYVVSSLVKRDGSDGGWLRKCGLQANSVGLQVDEDIKGNRSHTSEMAATFVFSQAFEADFYVVDHFLIAHSGSAVTCEAETVVITAHNNVDSPSPADGKHIRIIATSNTPGWRPDDVTWGLKSGAGVFVTPTAAVAEYVFDGDESSVELWLSNTSVADIDIDIVDVNDMSITDKDDGSIEDPVLPFNDSGLRFYADVDSDNNADGISPIQSPLVAGQSSGQMILRAVETSPQTGACLARVVGNQSVSMAYECINPNTCIRDKDMLISGVPIEENNVSAVSDYTSLTLNFDAQGEAVFTLTYFDVGEVRLHAQLILAATSNDPPFSLVGSSGGSVVMPADFLVTTITDTVSFPDVTRANPQTTTTGVGFIAAGDPFSVVVRSVGATGLITPNYGRELSPEGVGVVLNNLVMPVSGSLGLMGNSSAFLGTSVSGEFTNTALTWSEVGTMTLKAQVADMNYLGEGNIVGSVSPPVGRFYPKEYDLDSSSVDNGCVTGGFTYMSDQAMSYRPMSVNYTVRAISAVGAVMSNYDSSLGYPVHNLRWVAENDDDGIDLFDRLYMPPGQWSNGLWIVNGSNNAGFRRSLSGTNEQIDGPFSNLQLGLVLDGSGVDPTLFSPSEVTFNPDTVGDCNVSGDCSAVALSGLVNMQFGRLIAGSVFGPETSALSVPFQSEIWNGRGFVINEVDSCTQLSAADITFNGGKLSTDSNRTQTVGGGSTVGLFTVFSPSVSISLSNGDAGLNFSAPGALNMGRVAINVDLTNYPWLRFDWDQNGNHSNFTKVPEFSVTFGSYRGHDRIIYWQEVLD